jgi:hypothetical protein
VDNTRGTVTVDHLGKPNANQAAPDSGTDWRGWIDTDTAHTTTTEEQIAYSITRSHSLLKEMEHKAESLLGGYFRLERDMGYFQGRGLGRMSRELLGFGRYLERSSEMHTAFQNKVTIDSRERNSQTASAGRQLTFVASTQSITADSGSFVSDDRREGQRIEITGTTNNNETFYIKTVSALELTLYHEVNTIVDEGPLSSTATITFFRNYEWGSMLDDFNFYRVRAMNGPHNNPDEVPGVWFGTSTSTNRPAYKSEQDGHGYGQCLAVVFGSSLSTEFQTLLRQSLNIAFRENPPGGS